MNVLRTPDDRFASLTGYAFDPQYAEVSGPDDGTLRIHYVDEGPRGGLPVLMFHGNPDWSYSFRELISRLAADGFRVMSPPAAEARESGVWLRNDIFKPDVRLYIDPSGTIRTIRSQGGR